MTHRKLDQDPPSGVLENERRRDDGRRKIKLRKNERAALQRRVRAEAAAALFLDLDTERTWAQIAQELTLSPAQLRDLTKTAEFDEAYNQLFAEIGHDPRFRAAQAAVSDMLPLAVRELKSLLTTPRTPPGVKLKAIERIMALNGMSDQRPQASDRQDLVAYLSQHNIDLHNLNVTVPAEFLQAAQQFLPATVEGEATDVAPPFDVESTD